MSKTAVNIAILVGATGVCGLMGFAASMMAPKTEEEINDRSFRKSTANTRVQTSVGSGVVPEDEETNDTEGFQSYQEHKIVAREIQKNELQIAKHELIDKKVGLVQFYDEYKLRHINAEKEKRRIIMQKTKEGATASEIADALRRTNNPSTYLAEDILEKKAQEAQEELEKEQELKDEERKKEEGNKKIPAYLAEHLKKKQRKEEEMSFARRVVREEESKAAD